MDTWHQQQFAEPKRATLALREFTRAHAAGRVESVLDAGCGAGQNIPVLAPLWPDAQWTGVDINDRLIKHGRAILDGRASLRVGNLSELEATYGPDRFDVTFSIMVLSWLPSYERALDQMLAVTRQCLVVTSLFSECALDAYTQIIGPDYREHYNVYSLPRFRDFCKARGAEIVAQPYEIDIDIERPEHGLMQTYTERLVDGRRMQISGPVWMQWWMIAVVL